ncbi:MAG: PrsW family intramembrane metalloprotease [Butyrivibrio sp.]|uniref:PrsW family intramembrane metalloprotease n=1 Tax=Butyrivibrio sp. TaxID=28121 RepID=UPI0025C2D99A|nr:PrsW family glutamic-type intramembrane protease [Butyrivibrio sp.]MBQ6588333.1 PrsW family intramembrane metalloprotease [Butyrivibrio sp.]
MLMMYLAILPAAVLLYYIYKADKIEKEPADLLVKIFLFGVLSTLSAYILEVVGGGILGLFFYEESVLYMALENFLVVALAEEAGKYVVVKKLTWKHPAFNYTFDAVVYAVFASLGFALLENILYIADGTFFTAIMRALLAVPGHAIDAVFMGCYFGAAKKCEVLGDNNGRDRNLKLALIIPVMVHGFYDFVLSVADIYPFAMFVFFLFEVVITIYAIRKVNTLSKTDTALFAQAQPIAPMPGFTPVQSVVPGQTVAPAKPAMNFDPMTGQRLTPVEPQKFAMNFDPMTGQRLTPVEPAPQAPVQEFVPVQPVQYDPVTGQPVINPES